MLTVDRDRADPTTLTARQTYVEVARTFVSLIAPSDLTSRPVSVLSPGRRTVLSRSLIQSKIGLGLPVELHSNVVDPAMGKMT